MAGELRESEVELKAGSTRAERPWRSGATVSSSSPAFGWGGELARERGDWIAGVLLVLKCMREGETGALPKAYHGGGEVAAAEHNRGCVARERGLQRGWSGARGLRGCRVWRWAGGGGLRPSLGGGRRRSTPAAEEAERERGGR